ncbi:recombination protein NinB [Serratia marcescens]|uniref:recombination protein NinB n=1 Tax=Serratia marcescens TaxID=615 RepID=UPI0025A47A39|nr:recombination protein NinB [Serratia marcescens]MDM8341383.1 recombination protein NinB [Serratia marcescens]
MAKQVFYLRSPQIRQNLKTFIDSLPLNPDKPLAVTIQEPTLSTTKMLLLSLAWPGNAVLFLLMRCVR